MKVINDRYHVLDTLSKESSVVEYLVEDIKNNYQVKRIRIFDTEMSNYEFMKSMEENFVDISTYIHENILAAYEFKPIYTINGSKVTRKQFFYTYENYDENSVVPYFELNKSEINSCIVQLCKVMRYLHYRGLVYKYLNFNSIVFIRENGQIKIKLKDIANNYINDYFFKLDHERYQQFIAPEIIWGEEVDVHADIYSLGVLFYYLYYRVDYNLKSLHNLSKSSNVTDIHRFIMKASNNIKDERHRSIHDFIDELKKLIWIDIDFDDINYFDCIIDKSKIIGRDAVIKEAKDIIFNKLKKVTTYNGIYIQGENGMGKTRVLKELEYIAKFNRIAFVSISLKNPMLNNGFYAIKEIISFIASQDDVSPILIQKYGQELAKIVPDLSLKWNIKEFKEINVEDQKLRLLNRAFNFFVEYTSNKYMVILIDDEESIHADERYFFDQLLHHRGRINYILVFTGSELDRPYQQNTEQAKLIKLPFLNLEETGIIVQKSLGMNTIPYRFTHRIMLETMGKPSTTKKLVKKLWEDHVIWFDEGKMAWNLEQVDDAYKFVYSMDTDYDISKLLHEIDSKHIVILKKLSALKGAFNMTVLLQYAEIDEEQAYYFIFNMEELKILNKRISDVEYVFGFYKNEVKNYFYDLLTDDEKITYANHAAVIYEQRYDEFHEINETLIEYFISSNDLMKAASYAVKFSEYYLNKSNSHKGIDLLEQALGLYERINDEAFIIETSKELINNYMSAGRLDHALELILKVIERTRENHPKDYIDVQLIYADIFYYKNDNLKSNEIAQEFLKLSKLQGYLIGEFKSIEMICKCLIDVGDFNNLKLTINEYLKKASESDNKYYTAVFHKLLGSYYHFINEFENSLESFNTALDLFQEINHEDMIIKINNNFGVIYLDDLGDYLKAREYFRKAYHRANTKNYYVSTPIYLNNLGETYQIEGRFTTAIKYFEESYTLSENIGDKNMVILSLLNLSYVYLMKEKYGKTHTLINRLEHEINAIKNKEFDKFDYYMLHFEYYISMNSMMKVEKWRYEFDADEILDDFRRFRIKIIDLIIQYRKNIIVYSRRMIPYQEINELKELVSNPSEAMLLRNFIIDVMIDYVDNNQFLEIEELIRIDDLLLVLYNTKHIQIKRAFVDACMLENSVESIQMLIPEFKEESQELLWRAYKYLGDEEFHVKKNYSALKYYLMSLDIIANLTHDIVAEFKETYILYDNSKMTLKSRINKIVKIFLSFEAPGHPTTVFEDRIDTVDDYFDLLHLNLLYENRKFVKSVHDNYVMNTSNYLSTPTELIKSIGKDEKVNLHLILSYFVMLTLAERGMIYLLDDNDNIDEVIKSSDQVDEFDILKLINSIGNDIDGVYVSKLDSDTNVQILSDDQKALVFFPIYEMLNDKTMPENRREDLLVIKKRVVGYVFLDSKNVINRVNQDTFKQCKYFMNLTYMMIDNYNLKRLSSIDKLTGVSLRKSIELSFTNELNLARTNSTCLSVIMLDIDKFKNVNDTYGHRKGDEILTKIGELIKSSIRTSDYVGRYGGEEFIIILPETNAEDGFKVAEKIRHRVELKKLLGEEMPLSVSLGISTYPEDGVNEEELVEKADQALYYSKNNGRNQSNSWNEKLVKAGHRYDKLAGILTGNVSSDTRNIQALTDILNQLESDISLEERIKNTFITLLDITEAEEISFIKFDQEWMPDQVYSKKKGIDELTDEIFICSRLMDRYKGVSHSEYFIDWDEIVAYDETTNVPNWKSYIVLSYNEPNRKGILSITVQIHEKELDFSNYNFVNTLKAVISYILF